jgi:hypothetical protein
MFKTDKKSLERLSFELGERDLSNLKHTLEYLQRKKLSTLSVEEHERVIRGLNKIGKLKLEGKIYAFHVYDSYVENQKKDPEGIELWKRQGDKLNEFLVPGSRDYTYHIKNVIKKLNGEGIGTIYTGEITEEEFLGLRRIRDPKDYYETSGLIRDEIEEFEEEGIEVITLDTLI